MKKIGIAIIALIAIIGFWASNQVLKETTPKKKGSVVKAASQGYWTCPMHPQIHADHPGECPICHMKLVLVKAQDAQVTEKNQDPALTPIQTTSEQLKLVGVQRTEVEKMSLRVKIPISGRFISSSSVAFQIYETDLRYVKAGLGFTGASSFYPEKEITGVISTVDSIVDPTSRTVRVVGAIRQGPRDTPSETGFRGDIILELKNRVAIPESSVLHTGSGDLIYVFTKGNELSPKVVKLGIKSEGFYEVLEGAEPGQVISSGPNFLIDSESKIRTISMPEEGPNGAPNKASTPSCPKGQHWDIPMSMCMPGAK